LTVCNSCRITIDFNLSPPTRSVVQHFAALVKNQLSPASVVCASIQSTVLLRGRPTAECVVEKLRSSRRTGIANCGPFAVADGRIIHRAGGSEAPELAFIVASAVEYLRAFERNGVSLDAARDMIYFRLSADTDEFLTIAKFRALRKLWARIEEACKLAPKPAYIAAETA
jgi:methylmalonyl-CoA mutase